MMATFRRHPAMAVLCLGWAFPIFLTSVRLPFQQEALGLGTILFIALCLGAIVVGYRVGRGGGPSGSIPTAISTKTPIVLACFGAGAALLVWATGWGTEHLSLEHTRDVQRMAATEQSRISSYLYQVGCFLGLLAVALVGRVRRPVLVMAVVLAINMVGLFGYIRLTGSRADTLALVALGLSVLLLRFPRQILSIRGLGYMVAIGVPLFVLNVIFVVVRMESLLANPVIAERIMYRAAELVQSPESSVFGNDFLILSSWLLLEYVSDPIYYLNYFLKLEAPPLHYGLHQFSLIANRIPGYDYLVRKEFIDALYQPLGVYWNVWGTSVRDMVLDFGTIGAPLAYFIGGWFTGRTARDAARSVGAQVCYSLLLVWLFYTPFYSPIILRPFQMALIFGIVWYVVEFLARGRTGEAEEGESSGPERKCGTMGTKAKA